MIQTFIWINSKNWMIFSVILISLLSALCPVFVRPSVIATTFRGVSRFCSFMAQSIAYGPRSWTKKGIFLTGPSPHGEGIKHLFRCGIGKNHLVSMWCRNFPLHAFSDTRTEIISNRVEKFKYETDWMILYHYFFIQKIIMSFNDSFM